MHQQQATQVIQAKKPFIDKPIANSYPEAKAIFDLASLHQVPIISSISLRFIEGMDILNKEKVKGGDGFTPAPTEPSHKDLYWYGIHDVEMLFTIMGLDCE